MDAHREDEYEVLKARYAEKIKFQLAFFEAHKTGDLDDRGRPMFDLSEQDVQECQMREEELRQMEDEIAFFL